ncbi:MAG: hypothetical protein KatS3mg023_3484 [Armatimonadota bacterium]|nr:MAG: hypothetical protein KatS3mg023_3484 [Armatimonadota bacterium]
MRLWWWFLFVCATAGSVPLHDFEAESTFQPHPDGGRVVRIEQDRVTVKQGASALRLVYTDAPPHWGNVVGSCFVPPSATALRFWLYVHQARPQAKMHIWLLEPDGDMWVQHVAVGGRSVGYLQKGWHEAVLPISGFQFDGRGKRTREMVSADRMLIGCNFGDMEVTVDAMEWELREKPHSAPLPRTQGLQVERGERGNIAILHIAQPLPDGFRTAHPPQQLAQALRRAGFGVTLLQAGDLADAQTLTRDHLDAVILPYGAFFPLEAREAFLAYLRAGGSFLATDGYAFDHPLVWDGERWRDVEQTVTAEEHDRGGTESRARLNTRYGTPGDAMTLAPDQIGVFDPAFLLLDAVQCRAIGVFAGTGVHLRWDKPVQGFSSCGLIGVNSPVFPPVYRRWVPVMEALDAKSHLRGTVLSILHNFADVYKGSSWALSGITSGEPILLGDAARERLLAQVIEHIVRKVYLQSLRSDQPIYDSGEEATLSAEVVNFGKRPARVRVEMTVSGRRILRQDRTLQPGETHTLSTTVNTGRFRGDYHPVQARLWLEGQVVDTLTSAFCIRDEKVIARGPKVGWQENSLTINGKPAILVGTNQTGMMFFSANENPAVWDRDFRLMAQHHIRILRILHFSPFAKDGYQGSPHHSPLDLLPVPPERLQRQMDAIVQLAQKHGIVIFLSLHDWMGVVLTDEELQAQKEWNRFWAERYRDVPGILYDIQNEPSVDLQDTPLVRRLWNQWLKERYGSDEALREAWRVQPPEARLPDVPLGNRTDRWDDVRTADLKRFESELLNRWVRANVEGVKAGDPDALVCVGYLPSMSPADKILGTRYTDFSNMHYYGPLQEFPLEFKLIDRRAYGKGLSLGEFGAQEAHDARITGATGLPVQVSVTRFQQVLHYAVGLGATFLCNWDWKDFDEMVFPWGLVHHSTPVAKPWLHTLAQGAELLRHVQPAYHPPQVYLLVPDSHRIGAQFTRLHGALHQAVSLLLDTVGDFGVLNEEDLQQIPPSAKAIFWVLPYCPTDETFQTVLRWVEQGGVLYLSGHVGFDRARQPVRRERLSLLHLPDVPPLSPFETAGQSATAQPIVSAVGRGRVVYVPFPLELSPDARAEHIYRQVLQLAAVSVTDVATQGGRVRVFSLPTEDGGRLYTLVRADEGAGECQVSIPAHRITLFLQPQGCAFVLVNAGGEVVAAESEGEMQLDGKTIAFASGHYALVSQDGRALTRSGRILVLPHQQREVQVYLLPQGKVSVGTLSGVSSVRATGRTSTTVSFAAGEVALLTAP